MFRSQLLAGYERTQISIPAEKTPAQTVPVPASIRSYQPEDVQRNNFPVRSKKQAVTWKASGLSDFADAPTNIQERIKGNLERRIDKPQN